MTRKGHTKPYASILGGYICAVKININTGQVLTDIPERKIWPHSLTKTI
ncbi:MAG: hypothetical protein ABIU77_17990 [Ferruginibacter sp.]|jgi:hypothetical protein